MESVLLYLVLFGKIYKHPLTSGKLLWDLGLLGRASALGEHFLIGTFSVASGSSGQGWMGPLELFEGVFKRFQTSPPTHTLGIDSFSTH